MVDANEKLGILVVHGIGGPPPGDTLIRLADALEVEGYITHREDLVDERRRSGPDPEQEVSELQQRLMRRGPLPVQRAYGYRTKLSSPGSKTKGAKETKSQLPPVILAEAFWADITRLPGGIAGVFRGYFDIFFNLIEVIRTAAPVPPSKVAVAPCNKGLLGKKFQRIPKIQIQEDEADREPRHVRAAAWIARNICVLISGPIAAANVMLFLNFAWLWLWAPFSLSGDQLFKQNNPLCGTEELTLSYALQLTTGLASLVLLGILCLLTYSRTEKLRECNRIGSSPTLLRAFTYWTGFLLALSLAEFSFELLLFSESGASYTNDLSPDRCSSPDASLLPTGASYYLVVVVGGIVVPVLLSLLVIIYAVYLLLYSWNKKKRPTLEVILIAPLLQAALWMLLLPEVWRVLELVYPAPLFDKLQPHIPCLLAGPLQPTCRPTLYFEWEGLQALSTASFLAAAVLFAGLRSWKKPGHLFQRVIVSEIMAAVLAFFMGFACVHALVNSLPILEPLAGSASLPFIFGTVDLFEPARDFAQELYAFLWPFEILKASPIVLMFAMSFGLEPLRQGLSLADEIISYLKYNGAEARIREQWHFLRMKKSTKGISDTKKRQKELDGKREEFELRRPIRHCFKHALNTLLHDYDVTRLIIISHSQGTVIALDELVESDSSTEGPFHNHSGDEVKVSWVTMGSPIHHLYQHYFPSCYPPFQAVGRDQVDPYWKNLVLRVDEWVNIYRADDFVGTTMDLGPEANGNDIRRCTLTHKPNPRGEKEYSLRFEEHDVGYGGHVDYWTDKNVLKKIGLLLERNEYVRAKPEFPIKLKKVMQPRDAD